MSVKVIRKSAQKTIRWSGGTTTELAIYPENSNYADRNFTFRLSLAHVEAETSTFTMLPGVSRMIMTLEGSLLLQHKGNYTTQLNKFDVDIFDGGWDTVSNGKGTDFNLMTRGNASATLEGMVLETGDPFIHHFGNASFVAYYIHTGIIDMFVDGKAYTIDHGDLVLIEVGDDQQAELEILSKSELVIATISI